MKCREWIGITGQWLGMLAVMAAIAMEYCQGGEVYLIVATVAAWVWAISTKIRGK